MNRDKPRIVVTGATGRHGGTGGHVARRLAELGHAIRILTRKGDSTFAQRFPTAEIAVGDLHDRRSLMRALSDVDVVYFAYPIAAGIVDAACNLASAARETGLKRVVVMSMGPSHPDSPSPLGRAQWLAEDVLSMSGVDCIHLRVVALFFENLKLLHESDILGDGVLRNSFPDLPMNWIAGSDAGKLAVAALLHPERFGGKSVVYPSGSEKFTHAELAEMIGHHIGRRLRHETIAAEAWEALLTRHAQCDDRINADMARHISALGANMRQPAPLNDLFEAVTFERPMTMCEALASGYLSFGTRHLANSKE
jgi:uncharacterized protein YbjT (DUF2867 family)